jgi:hypothetical protein
VFRSKQHLRLRGSGFAVDLKISNIDWEMHVERNPQACIAANQVNASSSKQLKLNECKSALNLL